MKILKGEERKKFIEELPETMKNVTYPEQIKIMKTEQDIIDETECMLLLGEDAESILEVMVLNKMCNKYPHASQERIREYTEAETHRILEKAIKQMIKNKKRPLQHTTACNAHKRIDKQCYALEKEGIKPNKNQ